jgi:hypothetical protein
LTIILASQRPALQALQHRADLLGGERGDAALAGHAFLARELVHVAGLSLEVIDAQCRRGMRIIHQRMQRIGRERRGVVAVELGERAHQVGGRGVLRGERVGLEFLPARHEARERLEREREHRHHQREAREQRADVALGRPIAW